MLSTQTFQKNVYYCFVRYVGTFVATLLHCVFVLKVLHVISIDGVQCIAVCVSVLYTLPR